MDLIINFIIIIILNIYNLKILVLNIKIFHIIKIFNLHQILPKNQFFIKINNKNLK